MDVLLDTNLLLRCIQPAHPLHAIAVAATRELALRKERLCVVPQVLHEYYVVCTRPPSEYGGLGLQSDAAVLELSRLTSLFELLLDSPAIHAQWLALVARYGVVGKRAHDTRLVAAMNIHAIPAIVSFNGKDFARYEGLQVISPESLALAWTARAGQSTPQ